MSLCSLKEKRTLTSVSEGKVGENKMHAPNRITVKITPNNIEFNGSVLLPVRNTDCQTHKLGNDDRDDV